MAGLRAPTPFPEAAHPVFVSLGLLAFMTSFPSRAVLPQLYMTFLFPCPHLADLAQQVGQAWAWGTLNVLFLFLKNLILQLRALEQSSWGKSELRGTSFHLFYGFVCLKSFELHGGVGSIIFGAVKLLELTLSQYLLVGIFKRIWLVHLSPRLVPLS